MPLETYRALEVGAGSSAAQSLFAQVDEEAASPNLRLTGDGDAGAMSANLTPAMLSWLNAHVAPARGPAVISIQTAGAQTLLPGGMSGIVPEIEEDKLTRQSNTQREQVKKAFHERHGADQAKLKEVEREYLVMRNFEAGRDALAPSKKLDALVLVGILIPESFINYQYFLDFLGVGAVALGSTIVVGLLVGAAAFLAGRFLKAYHHYMAPFNERQKAEGLRMIGLALGALFIALMAIGSARYMGIVKENSGLIALGQPPIEPISRTAMLLFGNLAVFALGAVATYLLHDKNPDYARKAEEFRKREKLFEHIRRRGLVDPQDEIGRAHKQNLERMTKQAALMDGLPGYDRVRHQIGLLNTKDTEVRGVVQEYRTRLIRKLPEATVINLADGQIVDAAGFAALPIHLYRC